MMKLKRKKKDINSYKKILFISTIISLISYSSIQNPISNPNNTELNCLAKNIYFEAGGADNIEKIHVANVTLNRVKNEKFPKTICSVVYQHKQFSWVFQKKENKLSKLLKNHLEQKAWSDSWSIAEKALNEELPDLSQNALFYHAKSIKPRWNKKMTLVTKTKYHSYYKGK